MDESQQIIDQTKKWITEVVIGCNFCPFAARVMNQQSVFFKVEMATVSGDCMKSFANEVARLDDNETIETSFLVFPNAYKGFDDYLELISATEKLLKQKGYNGIYQLASFHPLYRFADSPEDDAANYTNRSLYPMLHLLREASIDKALQYYNEPEAIPGRNINFAREQGSTYMKMLRNSCFT